MGMGRSTEKIEKVVIPKNNAVRKMVVVLYPLTRIVARQLITAATDSQIRTLRRSYFSASHPTGICASAPPRTKAARKYAI